MARQLLDRETITEDQIREQIEVRQRFIADLDAGIAEFSAMPADGEVINMKTFASVKPRTAAKRLAAKRDRWQTEVDVLQTELDRRTGGD